MICTSIADVTIEEALSIIEKSTICEVRLDRIKFTDDDLEKLFAGKTKTLATFRPSENVSDDRRLDVLKKSIVGGASMIDIEVENRDNFKEELVAFAKEKNCKVIMSYHNYEKTPYRRELEQILDWCFESGAHIAKVACFARTVQDSARILSLYEQEREIIAIAMGELGKITRIAAPLLGAPFTYGAIDESRATAPGQITARELNEVITAMGKL